LFCLVPSNCLVRSLNEVTVCVCIIHGRDSMYVYSLDTSIFIFRRRNNPIFFYTPLTIIKSV
jgi:hypothetical protein